MDLDNIVVPDDISVQSNEERIVIDPITRVINIPEDYIIGVESDEKSDRMYFQCPKIVGDNVDLSKLKLYVNFENANKERDNYFVDDITVSEGNILFSWLFSRKVTKYKGDVKFIVCAKKSEDNLTLEWNTTVAKGLSLEGIEVELSDEEQLIASDYLIQLEKELSALAQTENNRLLTTSSNQITNITNKGSEQVQLIENTAKKALDSIPSAYTDLQKQVDTIESVTNSSATGIVETTHITNGYKYLGNSAEKPIKQIVIKGNSTQETTTGYQLFYLPDDTKISNGITTTIKDGLISCEGTVAGKESWFNVCEKLNISLKQGIKYTFSINKALSVRCALKTFDDAEEIDRSIGIGKTSMQFTPDSDISSAYVWIAAPVGTNIDIQFRIQVEKGSTAHVYEPYTGGQPSPSPEYPQEITCVDKILAVFKGNKSTLTKSLNHTLLKPLYRLSKNVYDYIDFNKSKIIRKIDVTTFDGSSDENWSYSNNRGSVELPNASISNYKTKRGYVNNFSYNVNVYRDTGTQTGYCLDNRILYIRDYNTFKNYTDGVVSLRKYLQSNPITVVYELAIPIEEDIPSALLTQLQALQTYYPETFINFTSNVKPFVDLEYIADTKYSINSIYNIINRSLGINSIDNDVAGVQINYSDGTNTRLAGAIGLTSGESFDKFKMFGGRKRCNVADDGTILAYYGDDDYKEDGSNGQVMVYQPKVYYLVLPLIYDKIDDIVGGYHLRKANYYVSLKERPGFKLHPAFINENGEEVDYILKSAFEGSIYDVSDEKYLTNDEQVMDATVDKLCSVANVKPCSGLSQSLTRDKVEQMAKNRGDGWHCSSIKDMALEQLLMMIELGSMNTQTNIGLGVVNVSDNTSYNCSALTGSTSSLGNATGRATSTIITKGTEKTTYTDDGKTSITYRGVENFWGNIWKFAEGVNFYGDGHQRGGQPYICKDFDYKEDFSNNNYEPAGFTLTNNNGYISAIGYNPNFDWLFIPSEVGGDSSKPVGDYNYVNSNLNGYTVALLGGSWYSGSSAGGFDLGLSGGVLYRGRDVGGRLVYIPNLKNW